MFQEAPTPQPAPKSGRGPATVILIVLVVALGVAEGWQFARLRALRSTVNDQAQMIALLSQNVHLSADQLARLRRESARTEQRVSDTSTQLQSARQQLQQRLNQTQRQTTAALTQAQQQNSQQFGALNGKLTGVQGDVRGVKGDVATTRTELAATEAKLQKTIGDLGVESGLIARTRGDLESLERRGDRSYYEFNLTKAKRPERIGPVAVQLRKADPKHGKYTLWLFVNDQRIEKKDRTLDEPVQFYLGNQSGGGLTELVVYQIQKNRVIGYVSAPKYSEAPARPQLSLPNAGQN